MKKQWVVKEIDKSILPNLPEYPSLVLKLLAQRGITDAEKIRDFLDPDFGKLHDPFLFKDMQTAVERIEQAIEKKEKITIYADYDADAITACATLYLALKKFGAVVDYYIPDRFSEGYGMNLEAVKQICANGTNLIITVDCGTNAIEEAGLCKILGVDLIITDHHELTGELPDALAIINPKNPHDTYPFPFLTGVGVAYKLVQALFTKFEIRNLKFEIARDWHKWLLDLVALGTVADLQSLTGENRILVSFGLKVLAKTCWPGMKALLSASNLKSDKYDTYTLGFILAPRINAAGRIKHADLAFKVLIAENFEEAKILALELNELNRRRQMLTEQILSEAKAQAELASDKKVLLVFGNDWPQGVVGLVAGRLSEEYSRPVLAMSVSEGVAHGSGRSSDGFDLVAALNFAKEFLQKYGGHTQAAGFTLVSEHIPALHQKLLEYAETLNFAINDPILAIDAEVTADDVSWENLNFLESLAPFGIGNPKPKLLARGLQILDVRLVGATSQHLKLTVRFGEPVRHGSAEGVSGGHILGAIAFGQAFWAAKLASGQLIDAVFELSANEWNGNKEMQLKILDIKINE